MKKCKWAGDVNDEYCKGCDGITMDVDGNSISCTECAGYEESEEDVISDDVDMTPTTEDKKVIEDAAENLNKESKNNISTKDVEKTDEKPTKPEKINNNTSVTK